MLENWKSRIAASGSFIMPYAEDAEYIGTSAYFYVKQFNQARFFEPEPSSVARFRELLDTATSLGCELSTPSEVIENAGPPIENDLIEQIENGVAWHGGHGEGVGEHRIFAAARSGLPFDLRQGIALLQKRTGRPERA